MSILDWAPGGTLLERPQENHVTEDRGSAADLRARIIASLLPAQRDFVDDTEHRIAGSSVVLVGKSFALCAKAVMLGLITLAPRQWWQSQAFQ